MNFYVCIACDSTQWTCGDGTCIPQEGRCNGQYDCRDYSDEEQCPRGEVVSSWEYPLSTYFVHHIVYIFLTF